MKRFIQRALKDIGENQFLNLVAVATIALSILIASAFALFFLNAGEVLNLWQKDIRMMVYLLPDTAESARLDIQLRLKEIPGVQEAAYISKTEALQRLKAQMGHQSGFLQDLRENPLPDAFEITLRSNFHTLEELQIAAGKIMALPGVAEVEYGEPWIRRFGAVVHLFSLAGYAIGTLFFMATIFIVANTIRLVLYSRRDEIEIMRLVGASDRFIRIPFYLEGMIQSGAGTLLGLGVLFGAYLFLGRHFAANLSAGVLVLRFFSIRLSLSIVAGGLLIGWLGSWISLKQFLKG